MNQFSPTDPDRAMAKVAVIGGGTMGRGIALAAVAAGLDTTLVDQKPGVVATASRYVTDRADRLAHERGQTVGRLTVADDLELAINGATIVIEAVVERPDVKRLSNAQM